MTTPEGMPERIWAALDLLHEIKAQLRTHVEFDHATRLMAAVGDMAEAARAYVETALSSPPAAPAPDNNGWRYINYAEASWKTMPKSGQVVLAVLEGCDTGKQIYAVLEYVPQSDSTWLSDGCELSNAWDVIRWKPLDALPPPPALDKGE